MYLTDYRERALKDGMGVISSVLKDKKVVIDAPLKATGEKIQNLPPQPNFLSKFSYQIKRFKKIIIGVLVLVVIFAAISKLASRTKTNPLTKMTPKKQQSALKSEEVKFKPIVTHIEKTPLFKAGDVLRLTIFAEEDTWMQIKQDGSIVFKRILKKGVSETWQAKENFELWLANAGTVKLELNGSILPSIGRRGQLLKSVLITKDGLTVQKK